MRQIGSAELVGSSQSIRALRRSLDRIAQSSAKVLITGESGVGKELVARAIHARSARARRPFLAINCGGLAETLLESELFGHVKGSFTGAYRDKPGKLELADGGTMLLDEVGEMSLRMQGLLLRVLEAGELQRVGSDSAIRRVDVRIIAATHRDLRAMVAEGTFRQDLFYRLNVIHVVVPPLRQRREDIQVLAEQFLRDLARENGSTVRAISADAMAMLVEYSWPGNVRELQNVMERLTVTMDEETVGVADLPAEIRPSLPVSEQTNSTGQVPAREEQMADALYKRLSEKRESFWDVVYPLYMEREVTKATVRAVVDRGLREAHGSYRVLTDLFNVDARDYRRFINFLRKHGCQLPFREYRARACQSRLSPPAGGYLSAPMH
jgi:transcriptional regulator with PAS, ATPase and Fis domain